jgi:hypothetical protein
MELESHKVVEKQVEITSLLEPPVKKRKGRAKKLPECYLEVPYTDETASLVYLSKVHNLDISALFYLWEKYGRDVWYFFYLFAGREIRMPKFSKYERLRQLSSEMRGAVIGGRDFSSAVAQEREAYLAQKSLFDGKSSLIIPIEEPTTGG